MRSILRGCVIAALAVCPALLAQPLKLGQLLAPGNQVMQLIEIDAVAKKLHGALNLRPPITRTLRPYFCRDQYLIATIDNGLTQHTLSLAIHGR